MIDRTEPYEDASPPASAMVESLRGVGYSLATAIADIIDNSIAASAQNVWLQFQWSGADSWISILDDGSGMLEEELSSAMKLGGKSPLEERSKTDLGRFGLGLKTASFSQCRRLTVATKKQGAISTRRWDLDYIAKANEGWPLLKRPHEGAEGRLAPLSYLKNGTLVLWEELDRIVGDARVGDERAHDAFLAQIDYVEKHLAMVFHRFLDGKKSGVNIYINGSDDNDRIRPWDPFLTNLATRKRPLEPIPTEFGSVKVQGFILPHKDRLAKKDFEQGAGPEGWTAQQGFYVYRNKRLLVPGSWLGLGRGKRWSKEEAHKLARIQLDIPNTADSAWKIDIKKSTARPPLAIRERLIAIAEDVRERARKVFVHRGSYGTATTVDDLKQVWNSARTSSGIKYIIDRRHPVVRGVLEKMSSAAKDVEDMLRVIEETVPVQRIWLDSVETEGTETGNFKNDPPDEVKRVLLALYSGFRTKHGLDENTAKQRLRCTDPFHHYQEYIDELKDSHLEQAE